MRDVSLSGDLFVDTDDIIRDGLEVAGSIVGLGDVYSFLLPVIGSLVQRINAPELLEDRSEESNTRSKFLLWVLGLNGGADQADVDTRRGNFVGEGYAGDVNILKRKFRSKS